MVLAVFMNLVEGNSMYGEPHHTIEMDARYLKRVIESNFHELLYQTMVSQWDRDRLMTANNNPLVFLSPIVHLQIAHFQCLLGPIAKDIHRWRTSVKDWKAPDVRPYDSWRRLRGSIEILKRAFNNFRQYATRLGGEASLEDEDLKKLHNAYQRALGIASDFEKHLKEDIEMQVGQLGLIESMRSIEQLNITIAESKRVKLCKF